MDPDAPNQKQRTTPEWAQYQRKNFWIVNEGGVPPFDTGALWYIPYAAFH